MTDGEQTTDGEPVERPVSIGTERSHRGSDQPLLPLSTGEADPGQCLIGWEGHAAMSANGIICAVARQSRGRAE